MSKGEEEYSGHCHPVRVYGDSDVQLAYITDARGRPTARTLIWPDKKRYLRIYGDKARLEPALQHEGYSRGSFCGARIRRIVNEHDRNTVIMPYLDGSDQSFDTVDDQWLQFEGPYAANDTNGTASLILGANCDRCDCRVDQDDLFAVGDESWCETCVDCHSFTSDFSDDRFDDEYQREVILERSNGQNTTAEWHVDEAHEHATYCDGTQEWYASDAFEFVRLKNGQTWVQWYFDEHGDENDRKPDPIIAAPAAPEATLSEQVAA